MLSTLLILCCSCVCSRAQVPDLPAKLFAMLDELKYLNGADKEGLGELLPCSNSLPRYRVASWVFESVSGKRQPCTCGRCQPG